MSECEPSLGNWPRKIKVLGITAQKKIFLLLIVVHSSCIFTSDFSPLLFWEMKQTHFWPFGELFAFSDIDGWMVSQVAGDTPLITT